MANPVGYRFRPTNVELINDYLRPKNLDEDTTEVDRIISTVNICRYDPWELPCQAKMNSSDQVWYLFGRIEWKYNRGSQQIRKTKSGFWKKTGETGKIMNRSGEQIGEKRVLMFYLKKGKTNWVMHEYHLFPFDQDMAYTICKVKFKGAESEIFSPPGNEISHSSITDVNSSGALSSVSEVGQSQNITGSEGFSVEPLHMEELTGSEGFSVEPLHMEELTGSEGFSIEPLHTEELEKPPLFSGFLHLEEDAQYEYVMRKTFENLSDDDFKNLFTEVEQHNVLSVQEDRSNYRPKPPVTGVMIGDDSDSDSVSTTTTISIQTVSTCDSFGSSNHPIELQESPNSTIKLVPITQEVNQVPGQVTETEEHKLGQETIKKKRAGSFYRMIQRLFKKINLCSSIPRT